MSSSSVLFREKLLSWPAMNCSTSTSTPSLSSSGYFLLHPNSVLLLLLSLQVVIFANTRVLFCDCSKDQCQFSFCIFLSFWLIETDEKNSPILKITQKISFEFSQQKSSATQANFSNMGLVVPKIYKTALFDCIADFKRKKFKLVCFVKNLARFVRKIVN